MSQTVQQVLNDATFFTDEVEYAFIQIHPRGITVAASIIAEVGDPFSMIIVDKDEVTLVIPANLTAEFDTRLSQATISDVIYRLITLDLLLEPGLIGLMAVISRALADAGVSILPLAAFSRDHVLVPSDQFETAMQALKKLKSSQK